MATSTSALSSLLSVGGLATGIDTKLDLFADMDELFAKLKGVNGPDLTVTAGQPLQFVMPAYQTGDQSVRVILNWLRLVKP